MNADISSLNARINIDGLKWVERWRINNGKAASFVVPFPTTRPVNIVTHGQSPFDYGQYGIHLGQQDVLTFLGDEQLRATAKFIDCRQGSKTFRQALELEFSPSSGRTLIIPPGVAHTFHKLEGIFTLNSYQLFLPPLQVLLKPDLGWTPESDIINIPLNTNAASVEGLTPMSEPAANRVYYQIAAQQREALANHSVSHAETRTFTLAGGEQVRLMLREAPGPREAGPALPLSQIPGVAFRRHGAIVTGAQSRIIPLAGPSPFYVVDHGAQPYAFDSFGVHLGQEDHLTFLGPPDHKIRLKLVDMRKGSATLHLEECHEFLCDPGVELVIPCGVAHALFGLEQVFTLNRPAIYLDPANTYQPGKDVIDWPLSDTQYPALDTLEMPASLEYLERLAARQQQAMTAPPEFETPKAILVDDPATGKKVKVVLTKRANNGASAAAR